MKYHQIKNFFFNSNTYIIENKDKKILIIDPGSPDIQPLVKLINKNAWSIVGVVLTHEHADHIAGLPALCKFKNFPVFCSKITAVNIGSSRHNLSKYFNEIETFELNIIPQILNDKESFSIGEMELLFLETPGHSPGGACIFTSNAVFTGDTLLNEIKVPLNLPHSNKNLYVDSLRKIKKHLKSGMTIFPGHGNPFKYNS